MIPADAPEPGTPAHDDPPAGGDAARSPSPPDRPRLPSWVGWLLVALAVAGVIVFFVAAADWPSDPYLVDATAETAPPTGVTDPAGESPTGRTPPVEGLEETGAVVTSAGGESVELCLLVAESDAERQRGLMGVTDLGGYDGMLFRFPEDTRAGFWMQGTPLPLTVAFFDGTGQFVSSADMEPCPEGEDDCPVHRPTGAYRQAVEVQLGRAGPLGLEPGSVLSTGLACPPPG